LPVSRRRRGRAANRAARSGNMISTPRRKKTNKLYLAASVIIAVLVIASFAFASFSGGGGSAQTGDAQQYVEGIGIQQEILSADHIADGTRATYNSVPPTSGNHWPTPARCGFYTDQLPDERVVHNMEHGNIVISYNLTDPAEIDSLRNALSNIGLYNVWGVARAYDAIPEGQIALSTWGVLDSFQGVNQERIARFFEAYAGGLGPERVPC